MKFDYRGKLNGDGFLIQEADVHAWCKAMYISDYNYAYSDFHQAMALSIYSVNLDKKIENLSQLPVRFHQIESYLTLADNQLTSLAGFPQSCHRRIDLSRNPLSFEALMPLSQVKGLKILYLPIELNNELEKKEVEFTIVDDDYISIRRQSLFSFQTMLTKIEQTELVKQQALLAENKASFLALNQAFQQKTLFKGKRHEF